MQAVAHDVRIWDAMRHKGVRKFGWEEKQ